MSNNRSLGPINGAIVSRRRPRGSIVEITLFLPFSFISYVNYFVFEYERGRKEEREIEIVSPFSFSYSSTKVYFNTWNITKDSIKEFRCCVLFTME